MRLTCHPVERTKEQQRESSLHLKDANKERGVLLRGVFQDSLPPTSQSMAFLPMLRVQVNISMGDRKLKYNLEANLNFELFSFDFPFAVVAVIVG